MIDQENREPPPWMERLLAELPASASLSDAARRIAVPISTVHNHRRRHPDFAARIAGLLAQPMRQRVWGTARVDRFLEELAESSNVSAAAAAAGFTTGQIYKRRRADPGFARLWYAALAEGYDNLEMELLGRLRAGESEAGGAAGRKFDTATALRCLTAHRESVAREKGRRTLAEEVTTIASINAKIDSLRLRQESNREAIAKVRAKVRKERGAMRNG